MRRTDSVDFLYQLASLVVALIIVHAFYVTVVRPRADVFSAEQTALMAADPEYVQQHRARLRTGGMLRAHAVGDGDHGIQGCDNRP